MRAHSCDSSTPSSKSAWATGDLSYTNQQSYTSLAYMAYTKFWVWCPEQSNQNLCIYMWTYKYRPQLSTSLHFKSAKPHYQKNINDISKYRQKLSNGTETPNSLKTHLWPTVSPGVLGCSCAVLRLFLPVCLQMYYCTLNFLSSYHSHH